MGPGSPCSVLNILADARSTAARCTSLPPCFVSVSVLCMAAINLLLRTPRFLKSIAAPQIVGIILSIATLSPPASSFPLSSR